MPLSTVDKLGPYEILSRLAASGFAMEFMEGETLANRIEKKFPEQAPVGGAQLLEAIVNGLAFPKQGAGGK